MTKNRKSLADTLIAKSQRLSLYRPYMRRRMHINKAGIVRHVIASFVKH